MSLNGLTIDPNLVVFLKMKVIFCEFIGLLYSFGVYMLINRYLAEVYSMSREDYTTLWVKKSTVARLAVTGEGTADEQINWLIDSAAVNQTKELEGLLEQYKITVPCNVCGREQVVLKGTEVHEEIKKYAKEKCWGCATCIQKVKATLRKMS